MGRIMRNRDRMTKRDWEERIKRHENKETKR